MKSTKHHFMRLTSILLCIVMLFVFMPQSILAEGQLTAIGDTERYGISKSYEVENESEIESSESSIDDEALQRELKNDPLFAAEGSSVLKYVDNAEFAKGNHIQRIKSEEDLNTYVFRNDDGSKSVYILDENVKYVDAEGQTCEKDITLVEKENGFGVASNEYELLLPYTVSEGIVFVFKGHQIKMLPQGGNEKCISELEDNSIIYHNYYGEGLSLKYTPTLGGIKEEIVLEKISIIEYTFVVETDGLYICDIDGRYFLSESKDTYTEKESLLCLSDIIVFDAVGRQCLGSMCIITQTEGEKYIVTIAADENFLRDKETVYPVTIDPTIQDTASASNLIEDTPVFSGYPNSNFYNYVYLTAGYTDNTYKIGRIAIRLPGLMDYLTQNLIGINDINSVLFRVRDSSGHGNQAVHIYPIEQSWTETTATWNGIGTYINTSSDWGGTMGTDTSFDITSLVRGWLAPVYNYESGFMIVNDNESSASYKKAPFSSEYSTESYRPYVLLCYSRPTTGMISLNASAKTIALNSTSTLTATTSPSNMTVTWSSSNTGIATVTPSGTYNQQCTINASHAGTTTIRAACTNSDGITEYAECSIIVYISDGVYYIKNINSNYYLHVQDGRINNLTNVCQYSKYPSTTNNAVKVRQMWKIHHLGNGRYSIRPMNKLDMGLDVTSGNVDVYNIGVNDTLTGVPDYAEWTIVWYSSGYTIKNNGNNSNTLQVDNASTSVGANVIASTLSYNAHCRWNVVKETAPPCGAYLYDTLQNSIVSSASRAVDVGVSKTVASLNICAVAFSGTNNSQSFTWSSSDSSIATVNSSGTVTGISTGIATITGSVYRSNAYYYVNYSICVGLPTLFKTLVNDNSLVSDELDFTDDGLFLTTKSLSSILINKGITYLPEDSNGNVTRSVSGYYDDWYILCVIQGGCSSYGLYKMREQEFDSFDGNDPGVTISFIGLDHTKLINCFNNSSTESKYNLLQALDKVTGPGSFENDAVLTDYFSEVSSDGSYLIAEKYISFITSLFQSGTIDAPEALLAIFDEIEDINEALINPFLDNDARIALLMRKSKLQRIPNALHSINEAANATIYDFQNNTIHICNCDNINLHEKHALLACFTGDVSFNSFAAEVQFHADAIDSWEASIPFFGNQWYEAAIRADMAIGEEYESGYYDDYYDLGSDIVIAQANAHGEY